jgi:exodeoxyribonuclease VII small subunit
LVIIFYEVDTGKKNKISFEDALENLEELIAHLETGDVPLSELLEKFEEGNKLLKVCSTRLKEAELKIELLKKEKGDLELENFDPDEA